MLTAIIVAGGLSRRMGFDKVFAPLNQKPLFLYAIELFADVPECVEIVLVCRPDRRDEIEQLLATSRHEAGQKPLHFAGSGVERQDSVMAGLAVASSSCDFIAVHDAARPLATAALVRKVLEAAIATGAATAAAPVTDTLKRADGSQTLVDSVDRSNLWAMQTPQIFRSDRLRRCAEQAKKGGHRLTDEVSAFMLAGLPVAVVHNTDWNPKITFPGDLQVAETMLRAREFTLSSGK